MDDSTPTPQINVSKIPGGGGIAGTLFAIISMVIFLIGIPALRYFLVGAILVGGVTAIIIRTIRRKSSVAPHTLFSPDEHASSQRTSTSTAPDDLGHLRTALPFA